MRYVVFSNLVINCKVAISITWHLNVKGRILFLVDLQSKEAKLRNQYNQVPYPTQDSMW